MTCQAHKTIEIEWRSVEARIWKVEKQRTWIKETFFRPVKVPIRLNNAQSVLLGLISDPSEKGIPTSALKRLTPVETVETYQLQSENQSTKDSLTSRK